MICTNLLFIFLKLNKRFVRGSDLIILPEIMVYEVENIVILYG